ncbi:hypothetical protein ECANGB1_832 [Enterospora canceri]|uniref:Uncharacterized protein n=1 Tax=Enterospora canceri TaxID=1081671 RepID=A0A1Y1S843_9MICR|nr:hypothetical protein ECANGB1_832 [Enterospora canceri]
MLLLLLNSVTAILTISFGIFNSNSPGSDGHTSKELRFMINDYDDLNRSKCIGTVSLFYKKTLQGIPFKLETFNSIWTNTMYTEIVPEMYFIKDHYYWIGMNNEARSGIIQFE